MTHEKKAQTQQGSNRGGPTGAGQPPKGVPSVKLYILLLLLLLPLVPLLLSRMRALTSLTSSYMAF